MMNTTIIRSIVMMGWLVDFSRGFAPSRRTRSTLTAFSMGGYYNEPETREEETANTHMIFGVRCVERVVDLADSDIRVRLLHPVVSTDDDKEWQAYILQREVDLALYLLGVNHWQGIKVVVLEEGPYRTGLVSLALQQQAPYVFTTACSSELERLQMIQASYLFHEQGGARRTAEPLQTAHWDETLPDADVLVVMFPDDENREYYLNEWLQQFPCVVYMTAEGCIDVVTHEQAQSTALQA